MKQFDEKTLGKRKLGDPILANLVRDALDLPRRMRNDGSHGSGYPLDQYQDRAIDIAEKITNLSPKTLGKQRDARYEVTRKRALDAVWGVVQWFQDNTEYFERLGTRSETDREKRQRVDLGIGLISYEDWAEGGVNSEDSCDEQ